MIGYLQIQNFILSDKDRKISKILINDFKAFCSSKNLKVLNLFKDSFHNGKINDMKVFSIRVFNEYLKKDKRLIALFNNSYSCTENFYQEIKTNELTKMFIEMTTKQNDNIVIPFAGSGTECLGAKDLNRKFIGIEKEVKYYELAVSRVLGQYCH